MKTRIFIALAIGVGVGVAAATYRARVGALLEEVIKRAAVEGNAWKAEGVTTTRSTHP